MIKPYYETELGKLYHGDCLEIMPELEPVDLVLTDPPYGVTGCKWDSVIPLDLMWKNIMQIIKAEGAIVMTAGQPFTTTLISSNIKNFKYCWVWDKVKPSGFQIVKYRPLMRHEDVVVFGSSKTTYNPEMVKRRKSVSGHPSSRSESNPLTNYDGKLRYYSEKGPQSILIFAKGTDGKYVHPTQKPVALMGYLIKTYTNEGEIVLDFCIGSGTTAIACEQLNRRWIGIEIEEKYCEIAAKRIEKEVRRPSFSKMKRKEVKRFKLSELP